MSRLRYVAWLVVGPILLVGLGLQLVVGVLLRTAGEIADRAGL